MDIHLRPITHNGAVVTYEPLELRDALISLLSDDTPPDAPEPTTDRAGLTAAEYGAAIGILWQRGSVDFTAGSLGIDRDAVAIAADSLTFGDYTDAVRGEL